MSQAYEGQGTGVRASERRSKRPIAAWAVGETRAMTERERKLTAAVLARSPGLVEHVRREGRLPELAPFGGREIGLRVVIERRGIDPELSEAEHEVLSVLRELEEVPGGRAVLVDGDGP